MHAVFHHLTSRRLITRVLGGFLLSLAFATTAPWLNAQAYTLVCSASGQNTWVVNPSNDTQSDSAPGPLHQSLQCVFCLALDMPVPASPQAWRMPVLHVSSWSWGNERMPAPMRWRTQGARAPPSVT